MDSWDIWEPLVIGNPDRATITLVDFDEPVPGSFAVQVAVLGRGPMAFEEMSGKTTFDLEDWHGGHERLAAFFDELSGLREGAIVECRCDSANMTFRATAGVGGGVNLAAHIAPNLPSTGAWLAEVVIPLNPSEADKVSADVREWLTGRASRDIGAR